MSQFLLTFDKTTIFSSFFIKIKSVTEYPNITEFKKNDPNGYKVFLDVFKIDKNQEVATGELEKIYQDRAVFRADFAKISAICFGFFQIDEEKGVVDKQIKSIIKENEIDTVRIFWQVLDRLYRTNKNKVLIGHNFTKFDIPFYIKRLLKYRNELSIEDKQGKSFKIGIPDILKKMLIAKPWEQVAIDTADIWKFGGISKPSLSQIERFVEYERDDKEVLNENINSYYWGAEPEHREQAMKEIAMVGSSDIEIMMDFMTEMRTV